MRLIYQTQVRSQSWHFDLGPVVDKTLVNIDLNRENEEIEMHDVDNYILKNRAEEIDWAKLIRPLNIPRVIESDTLNEVQSTLGSIEIADNDSKIDQDKIGEVMFL